ncbi:BTAD domain-containing putative transcriptional regulator [Streptomyces sp. CG1]|uniref:AfsR/SARP family transcriptional regulator n=1 Tax=Streptomyces sp. CG1 TaxID=1287523 RepID=UPI0034E29B24
MKFGILGPLLVQGSGGDILTPSATKPKIVLANLLVHPDRVVSSRQLTEELWGETPPRTAGGALHVYVSKIRKLVDERGTRPRYSTIATRPPGYVFSMSGHDSDIDQFNRVQRQATALRKAGDSEGAVELLEQGLALWRGSALADVRFTPRLMRTAQYLDELYAASCEKKFEISLALGRYSELVGELYAFADEHPTRERVHEFLMLALYNTERTNDALRVYTSLRNVLRDQSGLNPSPRLQRLQRIILSQKLERLPALHY